MYYYLSYMLIETNDYLKRLIQSDSIMKHVILITCYTGYLKVSLSLLVFLMFIVTGSFHLLSGQTVVKLKVKQEEKLQTVIAAKISTTDNTPLILSDSLIIKGGTPPYTYEWTEGNILLSGNQIMEIRPDNIPSTYTVKISDSNNCSSTSTVSVVVGIEERDMLHVNVYPVPATTFLIIDPGNSLADLKLTLYDFSGTVIWRNEISRKTKLPVNLPAGIYLLEIKHDYGTSVRKIIITGSR